MPDPTDACFRYPPDGGKGWTSWRSTGGAGDIEMVWWQARQLHFPRLAVTSYFDGSEMVAIHDWSFNPGRWCMKKPPVDWQPRPAGYLAEAERVWLAFRSLALHQERHTARLRRRRWPLDPLPARCWGCG